MSHGLEDVFERVPELNGRVLDVQALPGGLTNANHRVDTDDGAYVVRRWKPETSLLAIDRDCEHANSVRAADAGVGPPVVAYLPEHHAMVFRFLPGETMDAEAVRSGRHIEAVADACRRLHAARPFEGDFDMFAVQARYLAMVRERGLRLPDGYEAYAPHLDAAREALRARAEERVPCHNDLLAENLILHRGRISIIDFEYSGMNEPSFEVGNLCAESGLDPRQLEAVVHAYWERPLRHKVARARLWGTVARYGWTLWASIQDGVSAIDFDFWGWGITKYEEAVTAFEDPGFEALLEEARRSD